VRALTHRAVDQQLGLPIDWPAPSAAIGADFGC